MQRRTCTCPASCPDCVDISSWPGDSKSLISSSHGKLEVTDSHRAFEHSSCLLIKHAPHGASACHRIHRAGIDQGQVPPVIVLQGQFTSSAVHSCSRAGRARGKEETQPWPTAPAWGGQTHTEKNDHLILPMIISVMKVRQS